MAYQGVALLLAAVIGIGFAAYQYYTHQNNAHSYSTDKNHNASNDYYYIEPEDPVEIRRRRKQTKEQLDECAICQETLAPNRPRVCKLKCRHSFHALCIEEWFKQSKTCPICRSSGAQ